MLCRDCMKTEGGNTHVTHTALASYSKPVLLCPQPVACSSSDSISLTSFDSLSLCHCQAYLVPFLLTLKTFELCLLPIGNHYI